MEGDLLLIMTTEESAAKKASVKNLIFCDATTRQH